MSCCIKWKTKFRFLLILQHFAWKETLLEVDKLVFCACLSCISSPNCFSLACSVDIVALIFCLWRWLLLTYFAFLLVYPYKNGKLVIYPYNSCIWFCVPINSIYLFFADDFPVLICPFDIIKWMGRNIRTKMWLLIFSCICFYFLYFYCWCILWLASGWTEIQGNN